MANEAGWPDLSRPGVPKNPERDGWHWLGTEADHVALFWKVISHLPDGGVWFGGRGGGRGVLVWAYLGPCLTPAEVAATAAVSAEAMREACAASCMEPVANTIPRRWKSARDCVEGIYALPIPHAAALAARIEQAKAEEREACAKAAEQCGNFGDYRRDELTADYGQPKFDMMHAIIAAIRARAAGVATADQTEGEK